MRQIVANTTHRAVTVYAEGNDPSVADAVCAKSRLSNAKGQVMDFGGRALTDDAKPSKDVTYMDPVPDTSRHVVLKDHFYQFASNYSFSRFFHVFVVLAHALQSTEKDIWKAIPFR